MAVTVVVTAISTIIENSASPIRPRSRPIFSTTSSVSPRAFISAPMANASRCDSPHARAAA